MGLQEAQSILRSFDRQRWIVHDKVSFDRRLERLAPAGEHPRMQIAARETDLDAVVVAQVIRRFRLAMPIEIGGRSDDDDPLRTADPHGDHVALEAFASPQSRIETARHDIGERIVDREFKRVRKRATIGAMTVWAPGAPTVIRNRPLGLLRNSEIDSNASS